MLQWQLLPHDAVIYIATSVRGRMAMSNCSSVEEGLLWPKDHSWGGVSRASSNHPALGLRHVKASQAFTPSLSKEGTFC